MVREIAEEYYKKKMKLVRALSDDELDEDELRQALRAAQEEISVLRAEVDRLKNGNADKGGAVPDNLTGDHDGFFYALLQKSAQ